MHISEVFLLFHALFTILIEAYYHIHARKKSEKEQYDVLWWDVMYLEPCEGINLKSSITSCSRPNFTSILCCNAVILKCFIF